MKQRRFWILDFGFWIASRFRVKHDWAMSLQPTHAVSGASRQLRQFKIQNPKSKIISFLLLSVSIPLLSGCQTQHITTSDGWPLPPAPHAAAPAPADTKADRMVFTVASKPDDTDNNGFPDSIKASVALFSSEHPMAIRQDGVFIFTLYQQGKSGTADTKPIAVWNIKPDSPNVILARTIAGPSYLFQLNLQEAGGDRMRLDRADLICRFEPTDGSKAVVSQGVRTIQIGRRMAASAAP